MEKIDILIWAIGGGFAIMFTLMKMMWSDMNRRFTQVDSRFDKLEEKITDMDRRLCRLEGAFSAKECCALKADSHRRAE